MLNALILKNLRGISRLSDLSREFLYNSAAAQACGFKSFPHRERFSTFLKDMPNKFLQQNIRIPLIENLIFLKAISVQTISVDSCPVKSPVKENNLKTNVKDRFNKNKFPKSDSESRLGVYVIFPSSKKIQYFWGYRNHVLCDAYSELPIAELTKPANVHEQILFIPLLEQLRQNFSYPVENVLADSMYDAEYILKFIVNDLKAKPYIARNPRRPPRSDIKLSHSGFPLCVAGFQMASRGQFCDKKQNRHRHKFICPIKASKKFAQKAGGLCPWNHPKFYSNRNGCSVNLRTEADSSIRNSINYGSQTFKKLYNMRTSSERIFSRLLTFCMQYPSVKGLNSIANVCTIAHITVLAVALAAVKDNQKDKIRFIKQFIPNL